MTYVINPNRFASVGSFSPTDISGLNLWLDASDRGSTSLTWDDKSGNDYHYTSASGEFPTFSGGIATFDDSAPTHLDGPDHVSALTAAEVFIRVKKDNDPALVGSESGLWYYGDSGQSDHIPFTTGVVFSSWGSTTRYNVGDPTPSLADWRTINIWSASNDWNFNLDGSSLSSSVSNTVGFVAAPKLGQSFSPVINMGGAVKAMLIYSRKLTAQERSDVHDYLAAL